MDKILYYAASYGANTANSNANGKPSRSLKTRLLEVLYKLLMIDAIPIKELACEREAKSPDDDRQNMAGNQSIDGMEVISNDLHQSQTDLFDQMLPQSKP